jgi:thiol-disulfide isomerase/thioredoxin
MKKFLFLYFVLISFGYTTYAQKDSTPLAPYLKTKQVPGFKLLLMDSSTLFYKYQLKKKMPTVIIYFNPDCDHCQHEAKSLVDSIKYVRHIQFVFASYAKFDEIKDFDLQYHLSEQPNIKVGRDEKYFIPVFYKVRFTPFLAIYDKNGNLLEAFEGGTTVKNMINVVKGKPKVHAIGRLGFEPE